MSKFKVGDRVRYARPKPYSWFPDWAGVLTVVDDGYGGHFYEREDGRQGCIKESDLVLVEDWKEAPQTLTGGSSDYYKLEINGVVIECNDIIKALGLNFAQGNVFKAVWRIGADNIGKGKPGNTRLYNAEKVVFFGNDMVEMEKAKANG